jgi:MYXO-CTERM domain-containing protein
LDVPNATSYEVAAVTGDGKALSPWKNIGNATVATVDGLTLSAGSRYFFAVRAVVATGPSVDAISNGVVVRPHTGGEPVADDAGTIPTKGDDASGGCGCRSGPTGSGQAAFGGGAILLALVWLRRKRG